MLDSCEICKGAKGGVPGNENIIDYQGRKIVVCDYCDYLIIHKKDENILNYLQKYLESKKTK